MLDSPNRNWKKDAKVLNSNYQYESEDEFNFIDLRTTRSLFGLWSPKYIKDNYALIGDASSKIQQNQDDFEAYIIRANSKKELKDYYGAIADYKKSFEIAALKKSDEYHRTRCYHDMLELHVHLHEFDYALMGYSKLINDIGESLSYNYANRASVKNHAGYYEGAINDYSESLIIDSENITAYFNRGLIKYEINDYDGAIIDITQAIKLDKAYDSKYSNLEYYYWNRGNAYVGNEQYHKAISDYTQSIKISPYFEPSYRNRGFMYLKLGNINDACEDFQMTKTIHLNRGEDYSYIQEYIDTNCSP